MGKTSPNKPTSKKPTSPSVSSSQFRSTDLGRGLAETSWRIAVPFLLFSLGGIWLDRSMDTDPIFTLIGVILAITSVALIVVRYVREHFPETFKGPKS